MPLCIVAVKGLRVGEALRNEIRISQNLFLNVFIQYNPLLDQIAMPILYLSSGLFRVSVRLISLS